MAIIPLAKTVAISVTGSSSTAVTVGSNYAEIITKAAFLNTGATVVAVQVGQVGICPAAVLPVAGTPSNANIVLPASMINPVVYSVPFGPFDVTAIGSAAGPSIIYVIPCTEG
jgi:large exoprotein involved in heme utilization and adhesion